MDEPDEGFDGWAIDRARQAAELPPWWGEPSGIRRAPWAEPAYVHDEMHYGWTGDHEWARTVRPNPRYL